MDTGPDGPRATHPHEELARAFDEERPRLNAVAGRLLGTHDEAEDAVQEAWLRLQRTDPGVVDNLPAWLTTVVSRICLELMRARSAARTREETWESVRVVPEQATRPEDEAELADSVARALLLVLDKLTPAERVALVLHDVFAVSFSEVASVLDRSTDAAKMLASRARTKVRSHEATIVDQPQRRRIVDAFRAAAREGDIDALLLVLDPLVRLQVDSRAGLVQVEGAEEVARRASYFAAHSGLTLDVLVAGRSAVLSTDLQGAATSLLVFDIEGERIIAIDALADPSTLARIRLRA